MTSHNHLDESLTWSTFGKLGTSQSQAKVVRWLQVARKWFLDYGIHSKQVAMPPGNRLAEIDLYALHPFRCVSLTASTRNEGILRSLRHQLWTPQEWGRVIFCDDSKCTRQSDPRRVLHCREIEARFHPSYVTKTTDLGPKNSSWHVLGQWRGHREERDLQLNDATREMEEKRRRERPRWRSDRTWENERDRWR
ncbi:hypothetical protein TNCV_3020651 [Trichonephila clavipes]|nr:hypothetical protein TNCV_3020651 [Trichonephila clavipes]